MNKKIKIILVSIVSAICFPLLSHAASTRKEQEKDSAYVVPFVLRKNLISIKGKINGSEKEYNFIFDTGATNCVIDKEVAKRLNIKNRSSEKATGASGEETYSSGMIESMSFGNLNVSEIPAVFVDLSAMKGKRIDGIIGYDLLSRFIGEIDYDAKVLNFYNSVSKAKKYEHRLEFDFHNEIKIPQIEININLKNGKSFSGRVFVDTGAAINFFLNSNVTKDNNLLDDFNPKRVERSYSLTKHSDDYSATISALKLGNSSVEDVPIHISLSEKGVNALPNYLGILGNGILHRYNLLFDYQNKTIYYQKNHYSEKVFKYPCTNFEVTKKNKKLFFGQIQKGSDIEKLNIKDGQEIISINNYTYNEYKSISKLLVTPGKILKIRYKNSKGKEQVVKIKTSRKI